MSRDPRDDFAGFARSEHMFFGLADPYGMIRQELVAGLRQQVPDTEVDAILMRGEPKFLTLGRKTEDASRVIVAHFAFCLLATVKLTHDAGRQHEVMPVALTFLFGHIDQDDATRMRSHFDLHADAERGFADAVFEERFLSFRADLG